MEELLNTEQAAAHLGMTVRAFREHLYNQHDVDKDEQEHGRNRYTVATLERFRAVKRPRGRPKTKGQDGGTTPTTATAE